MYPSDAEIEAAARVLDREGRFHHWWPDHLRYDTLDPIGKEEFDAIVERILMAATCAKAGQG
jgi:3-dehydro-4-phosphotetronate decarboxylase